MYNNEMQTLMAEGGIKDEGGTKDPVSGNDVPPGALQSEVRDDIDAKISEGEFIFSADVVRYVGLNNLMKLRDEAKAGLAKMESIGQMGNASEVPDAEALHEDDFDSTLDEVMTEVEKEHSTGGMVGHYADGGLASTPAATTYVDPANATKYARAPLKGFEMVRFERPDGTAIYIPYINGKPQLDVPEGYTMKTGVASSKPADTSVTGVATEGNVKTGGGPGPSGGGATGGEGTGKTTNTDTTGGTALSKFSGSVLGTFGTTGFSTDPNTGVATANESSTATGITGAIIGAVLGVPAFGYKALQAAEVGLNKEAAKAYNIAISDTGGINSNFGTTAATTGETGTGGKAAVAASAAAASAQNAGYSDAAQAAAGQAAANAALSGATQSDAIAAGLAAAKAQAASENTQSVTATRSMDVGVGKTSGSGSKSSVDGKTGSVSVGPIGTVSGKDSGDSSGGSTGGGGAATGGKGGDASGGGNTGTRGGFAKGGLVSKPHKKSTNKKAGLASR
jgi:hypothetical protein